MQLLKRKRELLSLLAGVAPILAASEPASFDEAVVLPGPVLPPTHAPAPVEHTFKLRHIYHHGTYRHPRLHRRRDVGTIDSEPTVWLAADDDFDKQQLGPLKARSAPMSIERLVDRRPATVDPMVAAARERGYVNALAPSAWTIDETLGPDFTDRDTVLSLAYMAADAYVENEQGADWEEVGEPYHKGADFGWQSDGLRGHVFSDETNSTVVIGLKGTSMAVFDGEGTTTNDKINDNLFFSCCCAQQGQWTWHQVCDCATSTYSCNNTCVVEALRDENRYYAAARELYSNVTELYPDANVWLSGHSLGGAVSSLLGMTYGLPVVTFEAVPEAMAAGRLGLPVPPGARQDTPQARKNTGVFHFGHTADPIYMGVCHGATASCSYAGYALESICHAGVECTYDVVTDKGWRVGIGTHRIRSVINDVMLKYDELPKCVATPECRDCANWKMYESNGTETTTTSSMPTTTSTRTRTETCKTPGWWGCLDETTTSGGSTTTESTTTTTTTTSTSTCKTPGWFGCKDETTTTTTTTTTSTSSTPVVTTPTTTPASTTTCETPGRFWGCYDETAKPGSTTPHDITAAPTASQTSSSSTSPHDPTCRRRYWFGLCKEWDSTLEEWDPEEI